MTDLKTRLFRATFQALSEYSEANARLYETRGLDDLPLRKLDSTCKRARFCALWELIEEAELVGEYEAWKTAESAGEP